MPLIAGALLALVLQIATGQIIDQDAPVFSYFGTRDIDKLPRSQYAEDLWTGSGWYSTIREVAEPLLAVHPKPSFRPGPRGMERLCVIEAALPGTIRQTAWLRFTCGPTAWNREIDWLAPKPNYRALWLPVLPGAGTARLVRDAVDLACCEFSTAEDAPVAAFEASVPDEPNYVDHGFGLMPDRVRLMHPGQAITVLIAPRPDLAAGMTVRAILRGSHGEELGRADGQLGGVETVGVQLGQGGLKPGVYSLEVRATAGEQSARARWQLRVVPRGWKPGFGAHYANLRYLDPVYTSLEKTRPWDDLWVGSHLRDVVVTFPGAPRFVFWRGASYVPCWAFNNAWLTYEWLEAEPEYYGAVDCVEPIMDKDCRYSRARIVESSPARVVVHWSYALTDFTGKVIRDERADEYYTLYPDAVGVRKLVAWIKSGWHENQEFIALNRPGNGPHKSLEDQAVTFLTADGRSERPTWPRPYFSVDDWPHLIARVNIPGQPSPFMVVDSQRIDVKTWYDPPVDKPGVFNTYIHWPVSRGIRTTWLDDPADWQRPTHSNLVNIVNPADRCGEGFEVWRWLIGACRSERDTRQYADNWLKPGTLEVRGALNRGYDPEQRAYLLDAYGLPGAVRLRLSKEGGPVVNPAFVILNAPKLLRNVRCPKAARIETGRERDGRDLVVWIQGRFNQPVTVEID